MEAMSARVGACNASASLQASHLEPRGEDLRELLLVHSAVRDKRDTTDTRRQGKLSKLDCKLSQNQETDCCGPECVVHCALHHSSLAGARQSKIRWLKALPVGTHLGESLEWPSVE